MPRDVFTRPRSNSDIHLAIRYPSGNPLAGRVRGFAITEPIDPPARVRRC
jgi:hypothetical protein